MFAKGGKLMSRRRAQNPSVRLASASVSSSLVAAAVAAALSSSYAAPAVAQEAGQ